MTMSETRKAHRNRPGAGFRHTGSPGMVLACLLSVALFTGCADANNGSKTTGETGPARADGIPTGEAFSPDKQFGEYWYQGVAELNRYELEQARYGEIRKGDAVLIFVTEDFLADKQVKLESERGERVAPSVLKMNAVRKFITGLYPYSMMTSVFTPVDRTTWPHSLKVTTSSQEWCGHTFTQLNWVDPGYRMRQFSYFESEGDVDKEIQPDLLEDEVWTRIRLNPNALPVGRINILPGTMTSRLRHTDNVPVEADASLSPLVDDELGRGLMRYMIEYTSTQPRTLKIDFREEFPHEILRWTETYNDFGTTLTTKATRTDVMRTNYWSQHALKDTILRKELGLPMSR